MATPPCKVVSDAPAAANSLSHTHYVKPSCASDAVGDRACYANSTSRNVCSSVTPDAKNSGLTGECHVPGFKLGNGMELKLGKTWSIGRFTVTSLLELKREFDMALTVSTQLPKTNSTLKGFSSLMLKPASLSSKLKPKKKVAHLRAAKKSGTPALNPVNQRQIFEFFRQQNGPMGQDVARQHGV